MNPDDFKRAWQTQTSQTRLTIDAELLLREVRRNQQHFAACIFWRDVREIGVGIVMVPLWVYLGFTMALPWTWFLTVPALAWVVAFMLVDRVRQRRQSPAASESLRQTVESSLAEVEHQIWLLRNVFWWYILPPLLSIFAFVAQGFWELRFGGWAAVLAMALVLATVAITLAAVYYVNQHAVRTSLMPRRQELETLLMSLKDEPPAAR